jgi:hypothetical protein
MTLQDLARLAEAVRGLQKRYFADRGNRTLLAECKDLERRLDRAVDEVLNPPQAGLFDAYS